MSQMRFFLILIPALSCLLANPGLYKHTSTNSIQLSSQTPPLFEETWFKTYSIQNLSSQALPLETMNSRLHLFQSFKANWDKDFTAYASLLEAQGAFSDSNYDNVRLIQFNKMSQFDAELRSVIFDQHHNCSNALQSVNYTFSSQTESDSPTASGTFVSQIYRIICLGSR